jgi:hypothetical protein
MGSVVFSRLTPFKLEFSVFLFYWMNPSAVRMKECKLPFWTLWLPVDDFPDSSEFYWFKPVSKGKCQSPKSRLIRSIKTNGRFRVDVTTGALTGFRSFNAVFHQDADNLTYAGVESIPVKLYLTGQIRFTGFHEE